MIKNKRPNNYKCTKPSPFQKYTEEHQKWQQTGTVKPALKLVYVLLIDTMLVIFHSMYKT